MNTLMRFSLALPLVLASVIVSAANNQDYKCYVEYVGGEDGIQFIRANDDEALNLADFLLDKEVYVVGKSKKAHVYKVGECVLESESFTLGRAQELDKITPR